MNICNPPSVAVIGSRSEMGGALGLGTVSPGFRCPQPGYVLEPSRIWGNARGNDVERSLDQDSHDRGAGFTPDRNARGRGAPHDKDWICGPRREEGDDLAPRLSS